MSLTPYLPALLAPLIMWRVYSRYKRLVGVQTIRPLRLWLSVTLFPLLLLMLLLATLGHPLACASLVGGAVLGAVLAFYGLNLTVYHDDDGKLSYTPNATIGLALTMLMVGRVSYRMLQMYTAGDMQAGSAQAIYQSPLTMLIFGLVFAYYPSYSSGIMRWRKRSALARALATPAAPAAAIDAA